MKTNIIMIGFKSSGKTSVGRALAERLAVPFCDLDDTIQTVLDERFGSDHYSVRSYYRDAGADAFRDIETEALKTHLIDNGGVLASGGGAPLRAENQTIFRDLGTVCYIKAEPAVIFDRFKANGMPAYLEQVPEADRFDTLKAMWVERDAIYSALADLTVEVGNDTAEVEAEMIYNKLNME